MNISITYRQEDAEADRAVTLPPSKSIEARRLVLAAVRGETVCDEGSDQCDDLKAISGALRAYQRRAAVIDVHESGTALRFMTAMCAATPGYEVRITGSPRLLNRPLEPLAAELRRAGASVDRIDERGAVCIKGAWLNGAEVDAQSLLHSNSSQYLSALLLAEPLFRTPLRTEKLRWEEAASSPYLALTKAMTEGHDAGERDWSAASYFYLVALITGAEVAFKPPLTPPEVSLQGDAACADLFRKMGVESSFDSHNQTKVWRGEAPQWPLTPNLTPNLMLNMRKVPDLVPAVAAAAAASSRPLVISDIAHLAVKESNRLQSITEALCAAGFEARHDADSITLTGRLNSAAKGVVDCCNDHRIAMATAPLAALRKEGLTLVGAECVAKSFPRYFSDLRKFGYIITER